MFRGPGLFSDSSSVRGLKIDLIFVSLDLFQIY